VNIGRRCSPNSWIFCHGAHSRGCCALRPATAGCERPVLCRAIPSDGVRATDLPREPGADIEVCLSGASLEALPMGFREPVRRSTLAECQRDAATGAFTPGFAQRLIAQARKLLRDESLGLELTNTVYALDSTTIDLCLSLFPWRHFAPPKRAGEMHTLLDLRGNIPSHPRLGRQAARRSRPRSAASPKRRHLCHGSRLRRLRAPLCIASEWRLLRPPAQV